MALTIQQIRGLKKGQSLRMTTRLGMGNYNLDAKVVVVSIGKVACGVKVTEILSMGEDNASIIGNQFAVTFAELEVLTE
jgi:electron transfer flavoprotein alpha/beta subunit